MSDSPDSMLIGDAVVAEYLVKDEPVRVEAIAARLCWPVSRVRRVIRDNHGFVPGCIYEEVHVATYSRSYPGMRHGTVKADAYLPTRSKLRAIILADMNA